jgi:hypothetical protein
MQLLVVKRNPPPLVDGRPAPVGHLALRVLLEGLRRVASADATPWPTCRAKPPTKGLPSRIFARVGVCPTECDLARDVALSGLIDRSNQGDSRNLRRPDTPKQVRAERIRALTCPSFLHHPTCEGICQVNARRACAELRLADVLA